MGCRQTRPLSLSLSHTHTSNTLFLSLSLTHRHNTLLLPYSLLLSFCYRPRGEGCAGKLVFFLPLIISLSLSHTHTHTTLFFSLAFSTSLFLLTPLGPSGSGRLLCLSPSHTHTQNPHARNTLFLPLAFFIIFFLK